MLDGFETEVKNLVGKKSRAISYETDINPTEDEMDNALKMLRRKNVDICLAPLGMENMDIFFSLAEKRNMTDVTFLGLRSWGEAPFISMMEKHPDIKIVFPYESVLSGDDSDTHAITEEAERFQIEYEGRYGSEDVPTYNAALGYDAYLILINAIHNAKSLKGQDVRSALMELDDLKCSTGTFAFDSIGNVVRPVTLSTLSEGKPVNEYVSESEAKSKTLEDVEEKQEETEQEGSTQEKTEREE